MEKYVKPVMVLEKIEDELYTATADIPAATIVSEPATQELPVIN